MTAAEGAWADGLREAARRFFPAGHALKPLSASSGWSASRFARVEAAGEVWCLRRWPDEFAAARLRSIHRVLRHSRARGFGGVPALATMADGQSVLTLGGAVFDAQGWVAGEPLGGPGPWGARAPNVVQRLSAGRLAAVAAALARFHVSTADLDPAAADQCSPLRRWCEEVTTGAPARLAALADAVAIAPADPERVVARRWLALLPDALRRAEAILGAWPQEAATARTACHDDLWPRHVYVVGDAVSGFVDFESLAFGSAASDLAQLVLHTNGWGEREPVVRAYEQQAPLAAATRAVLPAAALLDLASEGLWSLGQLQCGGAAGTAAAHRHNLRALLPSLAALCAEPE